MEHSAARSCGARGGGDDEVTAGTQATGPAQASAPDNRPYPVLRFSDATETGSGRRALSEKLSKLKGAPLLLTAHLIYEEGGCFSVVCTNIGGDEIVVLEKLAKETTVEGLMEQILRVLNGSEDRAEPDSITYQFQVWNESPSPVTPPNLGQGCDGNCCVSVLLQLPGETCGTLSLERLEKSKELLRAVILSDEATQGGGKRESECRAQCAPRKMEIKLWVPLRTGLA